MKDLLITVALLIFMLKSGATSITVSGNVNGNWTADTIIVEGNLVIQPGELLLISPGTLVQFQSFYSIDVQGRMLAQGAEGDSILFTIRDTSNFYAQNQGRGGWSGIRFLQTSSSEDSSVFSYCRFEFSKATMDSTNCFGGAIFAHGWNKLRIDNCLFYYNYSFFSGGAIYLNASDAIIEECIFIDNYSGNTGIVYGYGGGICSMNSSPVITNNEFYKNASTGVGGAVSFDNSNPVFSNNIMQYNYSALGGALGVLRSGPSCTMSNNLVTNNTALFFGGGICCIRSFPVFSNFTVSDNSAAYAGGFYCNDSASPVMYNSIIWGNSGFGPSVYIWDVFSAPSFYYCTIEGDTSGFEGSGAHMGYHGQYLNNKNENPEYIGSGLFPFQLLATSPCKNAGDPDAALLPCLPPTDLAGAMRIENDRIDMGAYEYNGTTSIKYGNYQTESLGIFPNPFKQLVTISIPYFSGSDSQIIVSDMQGRIISNLTMGAGLTSLSWDGNDMQGKPVPQGMYFLTARINDQVYVGKMIK